MGKPRDESEFTPTEAGTAPAKKGAGTASPEEWARAKGHFFPAKIRGHEDRFSAAYAAAATLHGWSSHAHHAGEPMQLSELDFVEALKAAMPATGNPKAHRPALSKFCPHDGGLGG